MEKIIKIAGMHCKSCGVLLTDVISEVRGVESAEVDFKSCKAVIRYEDDSVMNEVIKAIKKQGYSVI